MLMSTETTTFERESLYKEVWAEPVRKVAKRYGLSEVGLRKICITQQSIIKATMRELSTTAVI